MNGWGLVGNVGEDDGVVWEMAGGGLRIGGWVGEKGGREGEANRGNPGGVGGKEP